MNKIRRFILYVITGSTLLVPSLLVGGAHAAIPLAERAALIDIYNNTNGDHWNLKTNWMEDHGSENTWFGVQCEVLTGGIEHVVEVTLPSNNLTGTLPASIGSLAHLRQLDLYGNNLSGSIPSELGNLLYLNFLDLSSNQLSGDIPTSIENLIQLAYLYLNSNQISGNIPAELGNLANLFILWLYDNQLTGSIPDALGNLENLLSLFLQFNQLNGSIPEEIGNLVTLEGLQLYNNQLTGSIPDTFGNLMNLINLRLQHNELSGTIPAEIGDADRLIILDLSDNSISGVIPAELGNLMSLHTLSLGGNKIEGSIPTTLVNLINLGSTTTDIGYNMLYTNNVELQIFLASKDPDWKTTQTVAPQDVAVTAVSSDTVTLNWTPIAYGADSGGYRILDSPTPGGPYSLIQATADKSASGTTVARSNAGLPQYIVVQTQTDPHAFNQNALISEYTSEIALLPGDFNCSGAVDLADAVIVLQIQTATGLPTTFCFGDVDQNNRIGMAEVVYVLQQVATLR